MTDQNTTHQTDNIVKTPAEYLKHALLDEATYNELYKRSITAPDAFWSEQAKRYIDWFKPWTRTKSGDFYDLNLRWFVDGKLNASFNCLDRHLEKRRDQIAIIWQSDTPNEHSQTAGAMPTQRKITYGQLHQAVCQFANVLKNHGIHKGDRVCIYLPMIPELMIAMLACVRIGAIHSVVFSAFSADSLKSRILDADCKLVVTADEGVRSGKTNPLKVNVDKALTACPAVEYVIVVQRTGNHVDWHKDRDRWFHEEMQNASSVCESEEMDADDPLFILYTSGSTGKPKGILHVTGGYLVYVAMTFHYIFNYQEGDVYWCTADIGWITGHSYLVYGPLLNGATTLLFEGVPSYPSYSRYWEIIDEHNVNIFYTAPTAVRALRKEGDKWINKTKRSSLKLLGTVGEPINPEVWRWYFDVVGNKRCPIVDTWWQTETGGILIAPIPGAVALKPGSATRPFFGIEPAVVDESGHAVPVGHNGELVIKNPWPGLMKTIFGDHDRFINGYFKTFPGNYLTGDNAYQDDDHYLWIVGRNDDVIKVSGHRIGTGEVEGALVLHPAVSEAAVVSIPHDIKGNAIYAFVTLKVGCTPSEELKQQLLQNVRDEIGPIALPDIIQWTRDLPKTRSGKIMRRLLRKIACGETAEIGDTSTLADPSVIDDLIATRYSR